MWLLISVGGLLTFLVGAVVVKKTCFKRDNEAYNAVIGNSI